MTSKGSQTCGNCKYFATVNVHIRYWTYTQDANDAAEPIIVKGRHDEDVTETRCQSPYMPYQPLAFPDDEGGNCWEKAEDHGKNPQTFLEQFVP